MYFDPEVQANSWSPSPEFHSFLEKQFRRKLSFEQVCDILEEQAIPAVDALCAPTFDPSVSIFSSAPRGTAAKLPIYLKHWETITSDPEVLAIVKGVKIPFVQTPHQVN